MNAYVIVEIEVDDPDAYDEYKPLANASVTRHGGRFVVRGGESEILEGEWPGRVVVVEFDSLEAARSWYFSDDYQAALALRLRCSRGRMIMIEGAEP